MAHISYTMSTRGLPDMYTLSPRASGVHIRQTTRVHGTTITYANISPGRGWTSQQPALAIVTWQKLPVVAITNT